MARKPVVSRTFLVTKVKVKLANLKEGIIEDKTLELFRVPAERKALLKILKKRYDTEDVSIVSITDIDTERRIYSMSESEFIELAHVIKERH